MPARVEYSCRLIRHEKRPLAALIAGQRELGEAHRYEVEEVRSPEMKAQNPGDVVS